MKLTSLMLGILVLPVAAGATEIPKLKPVLSGLYAQEASKGVSGDIILNCRMNTEGNTELPANYVAPVSKLEIHIPGRLASFMLQEGDGIVSETPAIELEMHLVPGRVQSWREEMGIAGDVYKASSKNSGYYSGVDFVGQENGTASIEAKLGVLKTRIYPNVKSGLFGKKLIGADVAVRSQEIWPEIRFACTLD